MSYIKYIKAATSPVLAAWSTNADLAYRQLDVVGRCGFMLEQSCILRYMFLAYGGALPGPLKSYALIMQERLTDLIKHYRDFYKFDNGCSKFQQSIYLGCCPTSNKEEVIEYWKSQGKDIEIKDNVNDEE
jgi:hypothetical protein